MKETLEILTMAIVYTIACILFGMFVAYHFFNKAIPVIERQAWTQGCNQCVQFQKDDEARDQLQGVRTEPEKIKQ